MEQWRFHAPPGHRVPTCRRNSIGSNRPPRFRSLCYQITLPISGPPNHVPDPMPCRGIAYQPRVQTLGIHPDKETRVLKERRIACVSRTSTTPTLCGVPSPHTLGSGSQGVALDWYALPRWGKWADGVSDSTSMPSNGTSRFIRLVWPRWAKWNNSIPIPCSCPTINYLFL